MKSYKVICVGTAPGVVESRGFVLRHAGHLPVFATIAEAREIMLNGGADIVLIAASVASSESVVLCNMAQGKARVIQLDSFTHPDALLKLLGS